jgi:hypothetical protein
MNPPPRRPIRTRFWMLGLLAWMTPSVAKTESVWVSTTVPPNTSAGPPSDIVSDSAGELWTVSHQAAGLGPNRFVLSSTSKGVWSATDHGATQLLSVSRIEAVADNQGYIHSFFPAQVGLKYIKSGNGTVAIEDVGSYIATFVNIQLASGNNPVGVVYTILPGAYYYCDRRSGSWVCTQIPEIGSVPPNELGLSLNQIDEPTIAVSSDSVRLFSPINNNWTLTNTFPGWSYGKVKNDTLGRRHLLMSSRSGMQVSARYVRWGSDGIVDLDQTFVLAGEGGQGTDLEIDRDNNPRFLVGSTYFDLFGSTVSVPLFNMQYYPPIKLTLVRGEFPFFLPQ